MKNNYSLNGATLQVGTVVYSHDSTQPGVYVITGVKAKKTSDGTLYHEYQLNEDKWFNDINLEPFTDPNTVNEIIDFLMNHVNDYLVIDEYMGNSRAICKADLFDEIRKRFN